MERQFAELVADLLTLNQQELILNSQFRTDFVEAFEAYFLCRPVGRFVHFHSLFNPVFWESCFEFVERLSTPFALFDFNPAILVCENVVVCKAKKMISSLAIPEGDHLEVVIAVAPI